MRARHGRWQSEPEPRSHRAGAQSQGAKEPEPGRRSTATWHTTCPPAAPRRPPAGQGGFSTVRRTVDRRTGEVCACKSMAKAPGEAVQDVGSMWREVTVHALLTPHPRIVNLRAVYESERRIDMVMEYCGGEQGYHMDGRAGFGWQGAGASSTCRLNRSLCENCRGEHGAGSGRHGWSGGMQDWVGGRRGNTAALECIGNGVHRACGRRGWCHAQHVDTAHLTQSTTQL